ncbi:VOC family protein [Marimonas arenosa]|uniref:VOC family protein n=1 Tax=Marimonas arenosa TaxID=1795305 RepID=A0AAE3W9S5_9RHOB|nr:VOC family protein [Marimonas arenosa]MDQ2088839.1 VOC family protein [Marimonas arenosa]
MPAINNVLEAALYVDDLEAAAAFYGGVLGLEEVRRHEPRNIFYRAGNTIVLLFVAVETRKPPAPGDPLPVPPHGADGPGHLCFAMDAEDIEKMVETLVGAGIEIEADFRWPNGARSVYVRDPAGNSIEFAEPKLWGLAV